MSDSNTQAYNEEQTQLQLDSNDEADGQIYDDMKRSTSEQEKTSLSEPQGRLRTNDDSHLTVVESNISNE